MPPQSFACPGSTITWTVDEHSGFEVVGEPRPIRAWPAAMGQWKEQIAVAAAKHGVPMAWIAAVIALESGGNATACATGGTPYEGTKCNSTEGVGLMAMLPSTASMVAGHAVSARQLMDDPGLSIDLGAKLLRQNLDKYDGSLIHAAVAHNAGSVRCGRGNVWAGGTEWHRAEPCPELGWGVIMGCVYAAKDYGARCAPSTKRPDYYVCSNDYPREIMRFANAAVDAGFTGIGTVKQVVEEAKDWALVLGALGLGVVGGAAAYHAYRRGRRRS
jgi:hypothetical protein